MNTFDLECLVKKPTCFQSTSSSCIDLILANKMEFFKNSNVLEVGISDHYCLIVTVLRSQLVNGNTKAKSYRDYNSLDGKFFKEDLDKNLISNKYLMKVIIQLVYPIFKRTSLQSSLNMLPLRKTSSDLIIVLSCPRP